MNITIMNVSKITQVRKVFKDFTALELKITDTKGNDEYITMHFDNNKQLTWEALPDDQHN
jgi:hypothetical protein